MHRGMKSFVFVFLVCLSGTITGLKAATFQVPGGFASIQAAIDGAPSGSTIEIAPGTYNEYLDCRDVNKQLYLRSTDGAASTFVSGQFANSLIRIENGANGNPAQNLVFDGITFMRGRESPVTASPIVIANAKPVFMNCVFAENHCFERGGAISIYGVSGHPSFINCRFSDNSSDRLAGAVLINGDNCQAVFKRCLFEDNTCRTGAGTDWNHGGALYFAAAGGRVIDCTFLRNSATYAGGAIMILNGWDNIENAVEVSGCYFEGNFCQEVAGGITPPTEAGAIMGEDNVAVTVRRSMFVNNWAEAGGALHSYRANLTVEDCVFDGNDAVGAGGKGYGGAIGVNLNDAGGPDRREAQVTVRHSLIRNSEAPVGGGIYHAGDATYSKTGILTLEDVTVEQCLATTSRGGSGIGGGLFLQRTDCRADGLCVLRNNSDWVGGGFATIAATQLRLDNSYIVGNKGSSQDDIHNPGGLPITGSGTVWAFHNGGGADDIEFLRATPRVTVEDRAYLTYIRAPYTGSEMINPGGADLSDHGGYTAGAHDTAATLSNVTFTLTPTSPTQQATVDHAIGPIANVTYGAEPITPFTVQAEDYDQGGEGVGYHDQDTNHLGSNYRNDGVDLLADGSAENGQLVAWINAGEWLEYTFRNDAPQLMDLGVRLGAPGDASQFYIELDGTNVSGVITAPNTGGWVKWNWVEAGSVFVPAGHHTLRLVVVSPGFNLDAIRLEPSYAAPLLGVSPGSFRVVVKEGRTPPGNTLEVVNQGIGSLSYTVTVSEAWMTVSPTNGQSTGETDALAVTYQTSGLSTGVYSATLTVDTTDATNAPVTVQVDLEVVPDRMARNDFDGDGRSDIGIYRPSEVTWYVFQSTDGPMPKFKFGTIGDIPVPADYDGDGRADLAVFRPSTVTWYVFGSTAGPMAPFRFGTIGDMPVPADYDGDQVADLAIYRPSTMTWYVFGSQDGPIAPFVFGAIGDVPVPADYDGDGRADLAVFRPSTVTWYVFGSSDGPMPAFRFGTIGDLPAPGDYDGDGMVDKAIFRPSTVTWYVFRSTLGPMSPFRFGTIGDQPIR